MIRFIVRGLSNKEIASEFGITEDTVNDRTQAAISALQHGIVHRWNPDDCR